ncbi:MAG: CsgG/HfaB family protein [Bacteroidota bacterium]
MKRLHFSLLFTLTGSLLMAQPNYSLSVYKVQSGRKTNFYNREAKSLIKRGSYTSAVLNAATALKNADKKRQFSEAQERLNESYQLAMEANLSRIEELKEATTSFDGDITVTQLAELIRIYTIIGNTQELLAAIPKKSFKPVKRKDPGFSYEPVDFSADLENTKDRFEQSKQDAAAMHYAKGRELENSEVKSELKEAAKHYRWANKYAPDYRDATDRYQNVKVVATTRMGVNKFDMSATTRYGDVSARLSEELLNNLSSKARKLEFFEVIDRDQLDKVIKEQKLSLSGLMDENTTAEIGELKGVDVILVGNVTESIVDRQESGPSERSYTKEVVLRKEKYTDDEGKERTREIKGDVTAVAKIYSKSAEATVGCTFKVLDVQTGEVLESGSVIGVDNWQFRWIGSFRGDKRALPSMPREERKYPSLSRMSNNASRAASENIYQDLVSYISSVGN